MNEAIKIETCRVTLEDGEDGVLIQFGDGDYELAIDLASARTLANLILKAAHDT